MLKQRTSSRATDLTNQIIGVLLRFREEHVGVMGDIEAMFHQVKVPGTQCSFPKFLWWEDSDTSKEIIDYEMTAHVFGGSSSPSCLGVERPSIYCCGLILIIFSFSYI